MIETWETNCVHGFGADYSSLSSATDYESLAENPLKLRHNFISRCSKADYPYNRRTGDTELKSYHGYGNWQGDIWKIGDTFLIDLLRCSVLWLPVINQTPPSRGGLKKVSRKSRDIQSPSQRWCELKSADSRAVTKCRLVRLRSAFTYGSLLTKISA